MECSDGFGCYVCNECGRIALANPKDNIWECKVCANTTDFRAVQIPYAYKLMMQEMETMGIASRIRTEDMMLVKSKMAKIMEDEAEAEAEAEAETDND